MSVDPNVRAAGAGSVGGFRMSIQPEVEQLISAREFLEIVPGAESLAKEQISAA